MSCKLLQSIIGVTLVMLFVVGCSAGTPEPLTATSTPISATPTPASGIGVPVTNKNWEVVVQGVHVETQLKSLTTSYTPHDGYVFLVVEVAFRNLDSAQETEFTRDAIAIISDKGEIIKADGSSSSSTSSYNLGGESSYFFAEMKEQQLSFVFAIKKDETANPFRFQFKDLPLIPFVATKEVSDAVSSLPATKTPASETINISGPSTFSIPYCKEVQAKDSISGNTYVCMSSEKGDYLGDGQTWLLTPADSAFSVNGYGYTLQMEVGKEQGSWRFRFAPPSGQEWKAGLYENADMKCSTLPCISISGDSRGCDAGTTKGKFEIIELNYKLGNPAVVERLAVNFEYYCNGWAALRGVIRVNSTVAP